MLTGLTASYTNTKYPITLKTIWKDAPATVDAQGPDHTSEYNGGDASFHIKSISKKGRKEQENGAAVQATYYE